MRHRQHTFYSHFVSRSTTFHMCARHDLVCQISLYFLLRKLGISFLAYIESGDREVTRPLSESSVHDDSYDPTNMWTVRSWWYQDPNRQDRLVTVCIGEHPPSRDYRHAFAVVLHSQIRAWTVVTSALTSDPLLATSDTDYLPSESIGVLCTLTRHTLVPSVRAACTRVTHVQQRSSRRSISGCMISFRVECLRSELKSKGNPKEKHIKNVITEIRYYIHRICKRINVEVYINYFFLHKYISQKYIYSGK